MQAVRGNKDSINTAVPSFLAQLDFPLVMGILNLTPDSFYDGGRYASRKNILNRLRKIKEEGARIIDLGGLSTRPGSVEISAQEEWLRIQPALELVQEYFPDMMVSVDTYRSEIAQKSLPYGISIVNDISGGTFDPEMIPWVAETGIAYVCMHIHGKPEHMHIHPLEVRDFDYFLKSFAEQTQKIREAGVKNLIIDPGFGFGKSLDLNYMILNKLQMLRGFSNYVLVGVSRKSMINRVLKTNPNQALNGSTVLNTIALMNGANILRVHDVAEAVEVIKLVKKTMIKESGCNHK